MFLGRDSIVYFDRIRINSRAYPAQLKRSLPIEELRQHCRDIIINPASKGAENYGYRSAVEFVAIKDLRFFEILGIYERVFAQYGISYLEIACDEPYQSKKESIKAFDFYLTHVVKRFSSKATLFKASPNIPMADKEKYSDRTIYLGSANFQYVIYPRISKINGQPCLHSEFRIRYSSNVKAKTGIRRIEDFLTFDVHKWFMENSKQYIRLKRINHQRHGAFLTLPLKPAIKYFGNNEKKIAYDPVVRASTTFLRVKNIEISADLIRYYSDEIKRVRRKLALNRKLNAWEKSLLSLTRTKINSFLSQL